MALSNESKRAVLESQVSSEDMNIFNGESQLAALEAEAALVKDDEDQTAGYNQRIADMQLDTAKRQARRDSFAKQLAAIPADQPAPAEANASNVPAPTK